MAEEHTNPGEGMVLEPGAKIGKYEVRERLASGGWAARYRCHEPLLDRDVVIKQIPGELADDPALFDRFRREAQVLARVGRTQPAVPTIYEMIQDQRGLFIVTDYADGPSVERILRENPGPSEPKAVLQVLWRLAAALHDVHAAGLVHRDLNPRNIAICEGLRPKITDFGGAVADTEAVDPARAKYTPPELLREEGHVDGRTDMYSLGFVAYEMLLGREKFNEVFADVVAEQQQDAAAWAKWHGNELIEAPRADELSVQVPEALGRLVARMIAKDPDERFASMEELGRAIKTTFSKAGRGPVPVAAPVAARPTSDGIDPLQELRAAAHVGPADEADRLHIGEPVQQGAEESPASRSVSARAKFALIGVVLLGLIGIGVAVGVREGQRQKQYAHQAGQAFEAASKAYDQRNYAKAVDGFTLVAEKYPEADEAPKAQVWRRLARARVALASGAWPRVAQELNAARNLIQKTQGQADTDSPLYAWTQDRAQQVEQIEQTADAMRRFANARAAARSELDDLQNLEDADPARRFIEARRVLNEQLQGVTREPFRDQYEAFQQDLTNQAVTARLEAAEQRGDKARRDHEYDAAETAYEQALSAIADQQAPRYPAGQRQAAETRLTEKLRQAHTEREFRAALAAADRAAADGDLAEQLDQLQRARAAGGEQELGEESRQRYQQLDEQIRTVQAEQLLRQGEQAYRVDNVEEARGLFQQTLQADPDNVLAQEYLDRLAETAQRNELVAQGDAAAEAGNWQAATQAYADAAEISENGPLSDKLKRARFQAQLQQADALRDAGNYDQALAAYDQAAEIDSSRGAEVIARKSAVEQRQNYEKLLAAGDSFRDEGNWEAAREEYRKAREFVDGDEIDQRIALTKYRENLEIATNLLEQGDPRAAMGYLRIAKEHRETDEVNQLIQQATELAESGDEE